MGIKDKIYVKIPKISDKIIPAEIASKAVLLCKKISMSVNGYMALLKKSRRAQTGVLAIILLSFFAAWGIYSGHIGGFRASKTYNSIQNQDNEIKLVSSKRDFISSEDLEVRFQYQKNNEDVVGQVTDAMGIVSDQKRVQAAIKSVDPKGEVKEVPPENIIKSSDSISVNLEKEQGFMPGLYKMVLEIDDNGVKKEIEEEFTWGVLAINTNKSIYLKGEKAYLQMAVLTDIGNAICDASLKLEIRSASGWTKSLPRLGLVEAGETKILSTENGEIKKSGTCLGNNVTDNPDYFAYYPVGESGTYEMKLTNLKNGREVVDTFEVRKSVPFEVERIGASRINPFKADYVMTIKVKANEDFEGEIYEKVPEEFEIKSQSANYKSQTNSNIQNSNETNVKIENCDIENSLKIENCKLKIIIWQANLKAGDTIDLSYTYAAPKISPELFFLGPLEFYSNPSTSSGRPYFAEARSWQIASDNACTASVSGNWSDGATWGGVCGSNSYPGAGAAGDTVVINTGVTVTLDVSPASSIASLTVNAAGTANGLTFGGAYTLTNTGTTYITAPTAAVSSTIAVGTGTFTSTGLLTIAAGAASGISAVSASTGTITVGAGITLSGTAANAQLTTTGAATINLTGTLSSGGTLSINPDTTLYSIGTSNIVGTHTFGNIQISSGTLTQNTGSWTVAGNWTNNGSFSRYASSMTFTGASKTIGGSSQTTFWTLAIASGATITLNTSATLQSSLAFAAASVNSSFTQADGVNLTIGSNGVTMNQPAVAGVSSIWYVNGGSASAGGTTTIGSTTATADYVDKIVVTTGTLTLGALWFGTGAQPANKVIDLSGGAGTLNISGTITNPNRATTTPGTTSTWNFNGTAAQTIPMGTSGGTYWGACTTQCYANLKIMNTNTTNGAYLGNSVASGNISGDVTVGDDSAAAVFSDGYATFVGVSGKTFLVNNNATFNMTGTAAYPTGFSTITFDPVSIVNYKQTTTPLTITNTSYGSLGLMPAGTATQNFPAADLVIAGNLTIGNGTNTATVVASGANTISVGGNWQVAAAGSSVFTHSNGTVIFNGTASGKTIDNRASSFYNVIINGSGGAWSPLTNTMTVANDLTITAGTLDTSNGTADVTVNGNVQCGASCGTINMTSTNTFTQSVSANKAFGTNVAVATNWTFNNLSFASASGARTITINGTGTGQNIVKGNLALSNSGTSLIVDDTTNNRILDVNGNVTVAASTELKVPTSASLTIGGNLTNSGTFTNPSGTVIFDGIGISNLTDTTAAQDFGSVTVAAPASSNDLVGQWKMDEGSGTITVDNSGYGNTGAITQPGLINLNSAENSTDMTAFNITPSWVTEKQEGTYSTQATYPANSSWAAGFQSSKNYGDVSSYVVNENYLQFWFYVQDYSEMDFSGSQVEFGNTMDTQEYYWNYADLQAENIVDGWNLLSLKFSDASVSGSTPNWTTGVDHFRFYFAGSGTNVAVTLRIDDVKIVNSAPAWTTGPLAGPPGIPSNVAAISFDGVNDYANIPNSSSLSSNSVTVSLWLKVNVDPNCDGNNNWRSLIEKSSSYASTTTGWDVVLEESGWFTWDVGNGTSQRLSTGAAWTLNEWAFFAFTYDSNTGAMKVYKNGSEIASQTISGNISSNSDPVTIAKGFNTGCPNGAGYAPGIIDEVHVYNRALSQAGINDLYTNNTVASHTLNLGSNIKAKNITINSGQTLDTTSSNYNITLTGDWTNNGAFTANSGTVTFNGADSSIQTLAGNTTFYNFTASTSANAAGRTLKFTDGSTTTVSGLWTITGYSGKIITLTRSGTSSAWTINPAIALVRYSNVSWSNSGTPICAAYSTDGGNNNANWTISAISCPITVSGIAYTDEGSTTLNSSGGAIKLVNNTTGETFSDADGTDGSGVWSISGVTGPSVGDILTVWIDGAAADGTLVLEYGASCSNYEHCTNLKIYQNRVILRSENDNSLANSNFAACDNDHTGTGSACTDNEIGFTSNSNALEISDGRKLIIWTGDTLTAGGTVTTSVSTDGTDSVTDGDLLIQSGATLSVGANALSVGGDYVNSGTFSKSTGQTTTFTATASGFEINPGSSNFDIVTFNGASGGWTAITNNFTADGALTITAGNFDTGAVTNTIAGATSVTGTLTHSSATGAKTFTGNVTINAGGVWNETAAAAINFGGNLTNNATTWTGSTGTHTFTGTGKTISGSTITSIPNVSVSGTVTNSGTMTISTALTGAGGFTNGDGSTGTLNFGGTSIGITTFTASAAGNTVLYNGSSDTDIRLVTYNILNIGASNSANVTYTALGNITANNSVNLQSAASSYTNTFALGSYDLTVGSSSISNSGGIAVPVRSTITQTGGTTTVKSSASGYATIGGAGSVTFNNFTIGTISDNLTYTFTLGGAITISRDFLNTGGGTGTHTLDVSGSNYDITVAGNWTNNGIFTKQAGTVTFNSSNSSWTYNKSHVITNNIASDLTNYQVKIVTNYGAGTDSGDTVYLNSHSQTDFDDIRFTDSDGNLIDHWLESKTDSSTATFWVEVPSIPASSTATIKILYGNAAAASASSGPNTFQFFDDFTGSNGASPDTAKWDETKSGSAIIDIQSNMLRTYIPTSTSSYVQSKTTFTLPAIVEFSAQMPGWGNDDILAQFGHGIFYGISGTLRIGDYACCSGDASGWTGWTGYQVDTLYKFRWTTTSTVFKTEESVRGNSDTHTIATSNSKIFFGDNMPHTTHTIYFDDARVRQYASTEPSHTSWGTENARTISGTMIGASSFYNITFADATASWTFGASSATVSNNFTITAGTVTAPSTALTISGNYSNTGTFAHNSGEIIFSGNASSNQTITTSGQPFYKFTLNNTQATYDQIIISGVLDINNNLTITDGNLKLDTNNPAVTIAGDLSIAFAGSVTKGTGTWTFDGSAATSTWTDSTSGQDLGAVVIAAPANDSGLVGKWKMDEAIGNYTVDMSGNNNTGTLLSSPTLVESADATTGWVSSYGSLSTTTSPIKEGTAALNLIKTVTDQTDIYYEKNISSTNMSGKWINVWLYIASIPSRDKMGGNHMILIGASDYSWYITKSINIASLQAGWNLISFNTASPDGTNGTPDLTNVSKLRIDIGAATNSTTYIAGEFVMDYWFLSNDSGPTWTTGASQIPQNGGALSFDGADDYVDLSSSTTDFLSLTEGTVSAWVNLSDTTGVRTILELDNTTTDTFIIWVNSDKMWVIIKDNNADVLRFNTTNTQNFGSRGWAYITYTSSAASGNKLYIDGVQITGTDLTYTTGISSTSAFINATTTTGLTPINMNIGYYPSLGYYFAGSIDEPRIYNRALSQPEITNLYSNSAATNHAVNLGSSIKATSITINSGQTLNANGSNTLTLSGTGTPFAVNGTFTSSTGKVAYEGNGATNIAATSYYNLDLGGSSTTATYTAAGDITASGVLAIVSSSGTNTFDASNRTITLSGTVTPFIINASEVFTPSTSTIAYTGATTATNIASATYNNLNIGGSATTTTYTAAGDITASGVLTIVSSSGTNTFDASNRTITLSGIGAPFVINASEVFTPSTSTVVYSGTTTATNIATAPYNNLTLTPIGATTYSLAGNLTGGNPLTGNLTINTNATLDTTGSNYNITLSGDWTNNGTFTANSGTVTFNSTSGGKTLGGTSATTFNTLAFDGVGGAWSIDSVLTANGNFNLTNGSVTQGANIDMTFKGNVTLANGTTFTKASGTGKFIMEGDAGTETFADNHTTKVDLGHVQIGLSPGTTTLITDMSATSLTIPTTDTFITKGYDITLTDYLDCQGTCTLDLTDTAPNNEGDGTIITLGGNWTMSGTGTFTSYTNSTVIFNDAAKNSTISGSSTFYNLKSITPSKGITFANGSTQTVSGALTLNGGACNTKIYLRSSSSGSAWTLDVDGMSSVSNVNMKDSTATHALTASNSIDSTGNTGWTFDSPTCGTSSSPATVPEYSGGSSSGPSGTVLDFDGTNDYLSATDNSVLDQTNAFSFSIWAKPDDAATSDEYIIYRQDAYYIKKTVPDIIVGGIWYDSSWHTVTSTEIRSTSSTWTHIELTYNKDAGSTDELKLYLNGVLTGRGDNSNAIPAAATKLYIGAGDDVGKDNTPENFFDGKIGDLKFYQYARSQEEVRVDYNGGFATLFAPVGKNCSVDPAGCVDEGLVGYWNMDEGGGQTAKDLSNNGNNGTLGAAATAGTDDPVWTSDSPPSLGGAGGGSLKFDGKDDYVDAGNGASLNITDAITIEMWMKLDNIAGNPVILSKEYNAYEFWVYDGKPRFETQVTGGVAFRAQTTNIEIAAGRFYHLTAIRDGISIYFYVDGESKPVTYIDTQSALPSLTNGNTVKIGRRSSGGYSFNGSIDEVRVYNRALSAEEIRYHYNHGGPVAEWGFDEGSGQNAFDSTPNNNNGWLGGTSVAEASDPTWTTGKFDSALSFDGTNDYVEIANAANLNPSNITVEAWFNAAEGSLDQQKTLVQKPYTSHAAPYYQYTLFVLDNITYPKTANFSVTAGGVNYDLEINNLNYDYGEWHHLVGTYDGETMQLYLDGKQVGSNASPSGNINSYNTVLDIGAYPNLTKNSTYVFGGLIDDVLIYNYARTQDQILQDYNGGVATHLK